jgi:hypothetical protein
MASPYDVAINISVGGNAAAGIAGLGREMAGLNEKVKTATRSFDAFKTMMLGGFAEQFGKKILGVTDTLLKAAGDFQHVQSQMNAMGLTELQTAQAVADARGLAASHIHTSMQEILEMNRHGVEIFGGFDQAREHMKLMADLADWQHMWQAGHTGIVGPDVVTSIRDMMKTAEGGILWGNDPKRFDVFADHLMKSLTAAGGNVTASQFVKGARAAKGAFPGWDDEFKFGTFGAMLQEWSGAGVGAATAQTKLGAGARWTKQGIIEGQHLGIINPHVDSKHPYTMRPGDIVGHDEYIHNPGKWFEDIMRPKLDKMFGAVSEKNMGDRFAEIQRILGDRNAAEWIRRFDVEAPKYAKDTKNYLAATGQMPEDYNSAMVAFTEKFKDLQVALGAPVLKLATDGLIYLTHGIQSLTSFASAHPGAVKNILGIMEGIGAAMTVVGSIAIGAGIAALLPGGAVVMGLTALAGGLAGLAAVNWKGSISDLALGLAGGVQAAVIGFKNIMFDVIKITDNAMNSLGHKLMDGIMSIPSMVSAAITAMAHSIASEFTDALKGLAGIGTKALPNAPGIYGPNDKVPPGTTVIPEKHSSLVPPARSTTVNLALTATLDGRKLTQVVTGNMVASATYPTSAAGADSRGTWMGPSWSPTEMG